MQEATLNEQAKRDVKALWSAGKKLEAIKLAKARLPGFSPLQRLIWTCGRCVIKED